MINHKKFFTSGKFLRYLGNITTFTNKGVSSMMKSAVFGAVVAGAMAFAPGLASAAFVSADFQVDLDLPDISSGARVLQSLGQSVAGAPDVSAADEIANPSFWGGAASIDLDAAGLLTLTGDHEGSTFADYDLAIFSISNIVFDAGETITGVSILTEGLLDPNFGPVFSPLISFTANSVTLTFDTTGSGNNADFEFVDGGTSTYSIQTSAIPVPAALPLMAGALGALGVMAHRRKAG